MKTHPLLAFLKHTRQPLQLSITDRLPVHIQAPCELQCTWTFHDLTLQWQLDAMLHVQCQRCHEWCVIPFHHEHTLVFCENEAQLKQKLSTQDCLLLEELPTNLEALIIDELHLYAPDRHTEPCL